MPDINVFVRPSQRKAEREAGLARLREQVKAGTLEIHWMSEEEKAAYRLREPLETRATATPGCDEDACEPNEAGPGRASLPSRGVAWLATPIVQGYHVGYNALAEATFRMVRLARRTRAVGSEPDATPSAQTTPRLGYTPVGQTASRG